MPRVTQPHQPPRGLWNGTISFGLVSIPVELFGATRGAGVKTRLISPSGSAVKREYFCPEDGKAIQRDELERGFAVADDTYIAITDEELESIAPRKSRDIDLVEFVEPAEIDPMYFRKAYFLAPGGQSQKAYRLLADTMERRKRAGIARFVMNGSEHLVAIFADKGILRAEILRFGDEVRTREEVGLPSGGEADEALARKLEKAIAALSADSLDEDLLRDERSNQLAALAQEKRERGEDLVEVGSEGTSAVIDDEEGEPAEPEQATAVIDLMGVLKARMKGPTAAPKTVKKASGVRPRASGRGKKPKSKK